MFYSLFSKDVGSFFICNICFLKMVDVVIMTAKMLTKGADI
jgi:hypothetical protein